MIETVGDLIRTLQEFDPCKRVYAEDPPNRELDPDFPWISIERVDRDAYGDAILVGYEWVGGRPR